MLKFKPIARLSPWRRVAMGAWNHPRNPTVQGIMEVDVSTTMPFIEKLREQTQSRITITHVVTGALARILEQEPDLNVIIRRGKVFQRQSADIFVQVAIEKGSEGIDLSGLLIEGAEHKTIVDIADEITKKAAEIKAERDPVLARSKKMMKAVPSMLMKLAIHSMVRLKYDFGIDFPGTPPGDPFGGAMITNVGTFGIDVGFAPLMPLGRAPILILIGAIKDKPVVEDGEIVVKPMLTLTGTFDHRLFDGYQCGIIARRMKQLVENPEKIDNERIKVR